MPRPIAVACALTALLLSVTGCSMLEKKSTASGAGGPIQVTSSAAACKLTASKVPAGNVAFKIKNTGSQVTEFYLYGEGGVRIVGEVENIGPGLSRNLVVRLKPGTYVTSCRPGMKGKGIRAPFTVTGSGKAASIGGADQAGIDKATAGYAAYVRDQAGRYVDATAGFVTAYKRGDERRARALYPHAREYWERIEPVAESFGDLDPKMDLREADLEQGQKWTGWHRIEKDLWRPAGTAPLVGKATYADDLLATTKVLRGRVQKLDYTVDQIANGSKGLLDEVAATKITGEEDIWSRTDLYDFQGNVDGARVAYEGLAPILEVKDPALSGQIGTGFTALQKVLDQHRVGKDTFVSYDEVTEAQRKELSDAVNALAEPLSKMTAAITL